MVVVVNARHAEFTGRKLDKKLYRWHTGCVDGLYCRSTAATTVGACGVKSCQRVSCNCASMALHSMALHQCNLWKTANLQVCWRAEGADSGSGAGEGSV